MTLVLIGWLGIVGLVAALVGAAALGIDHEKKLGRKARSHRP